MALAHYSPEDVVILVAGIIPITGLTDGTFLTISKSEQPYTTHRSSDGVVSRVYNNSQVYTVRLVLHSASPGNDVLTKLWLLDEITQRAKFPLLIKDTLGSSLLFSTTSWVSSVADVSFGSNITDREWTITCSQAALNIGGNEDASDLLNDLANTAIGSIPALDGVIQ